MFDDMTVERVEAEGVDLVAYFKGEMEKAFWAELWHQFFHGSNCFCTEDQNHIIRRYN